MVAPTFLCNPWNSSNPSLQFSSVQSLSRVRLFATPWIAAHQASLFITNSRSSLRLTSIESVMPSSHLILCCSLLLLPPIPPSIRVFSKSYQLEIWQPLQMSPFSPYQRASKLYCFHLPNIPWIFLLISRFLTFVWLILMPTFLCQLLNRLPADCSDLAVIHSLYSHFVNLSYTLFPE